MPVVAIAARPGTVIVLAVTPMVSSPLEALTTTRAGAAAVEVESLARRQTGEVDRNRVRLHCAAIRLRAGLTVYAVEPEIDSAVPAFTVRASMPAYTMDAGPAAMGLVAVATVGAARR